ncbi:MAG: hypothetical protein AB1461_12835 [Thermodesulfobacteriota bacterium]
MTGFLDKISPDWPGWLACLFLISLLVKTLPLLQGVMIHPDAPVYLWSAQALAQGDIAGATRAYPMLFYPFLVMWVHKLLGLDWLAAGRTISIAASCLALFPFFSLARRFSPGWPALIITLVFVLLPEFNSIAFAALRDPLYICVALFSLFFADCFAEQQKGTWFVAVIVSALCLPLLRVEGIVVTLVIVGWSYAVYIRRLGVAGRVATMAATAAVCTLLFALFYYSETSRDLIRLNHSLSLLQQFNTTRPSVVFYLNTLDELARNNVPTGYGNNFWQVIERNWPWIYGIGMLRMFEGNLGWPLLLLGVLGVKDMVRARPTGWLLPAVFLANMLLILAEYLYLGSMERRIMLFPALLWLLSAGAALSVLAAYLREKCAAAAICTKPHLVMAMGLLLTIPLACKTVSMDYNINIPVIPESCRWVKEQLLADEKDWQIWINMRTMAWFLARQDARQIGSKNKQSVFKILKRSRKPAVAVLLLSRRNEKDIALMKELVATKKFSSRVFNDPEDDKNFVVAVWHNTGAGSSSP